MFFVFTILGGKFAARGLVPCRYYFLGSSGTTGGPNGQDNSYADPIGDGDVVG